MGHEGPCLQVPSVALCPHNPHPSHRHCPSPLPQPGFWKGCPRPVPRPSAPQPPPPHTHRPPVTWSRPESPLGPDSRPLGHPARGAHLSLPTFAGLLSLPPLCLLLLSATRPQPKPPRAPCEQSRGAQFSSLGPSPRPSRSATHNRAPCAPRGPGPRRHHPPPPPRTQGAIASHRGSKLGGWRGARGPVLSGWERSGQHQARAEEEAPVSREHAVSPEETAARGGPGAASFRGLSGPLVQGLGAGQERQARLLRPF